MIGRVVATILLSLVGLVGLGMSLCGGLFTLTGLLDSGSQGGELNPRGFLVMSVPSLIVGVALVYGVVRGLRHLAKKRSPPPSDGPDAAS